jgi:hypothetical protein
MDSTLPIKENNFCVTESCVVIDEYQHFERTWPYVFQDEDRGSQVMLVLTYNTTYIYRNKNAAI